MTPDWNRTCWQETSALTTVPSLLPTTGNAVTDDTYTKGKTNSGIDRTALAFQVFGKL